MSATCRNALAIIQQQVAEFGLTNPRRIFQHRIEHRLKSPGEPLMTCSTSEVAVCCSSDSVNSLVRACTSSNRRAFSIAITAWSAKVVTSSICFLVNGRTVGRCKVMTPIGRPFAHQRNRQHRSQAMVLASALKLNSGSRQRPGI